MNSACEKGFKTTLYLLLLVIFLTLYFPDMVKKYQKKATTFTTKEEQTDYGNEDLPTLTICFGFKPSTIKVLLDGDFNYFSKMHPLKRIKGLNMKQLYQNATYQYKQDFKIKYGEGEGGEILAVGTNKITEGTIFELGSYNTLLNGKCYVISLVKVENKATKQIKIVFRNETQLQGTDMPNRIQLYITSQSSSKNVIWDKWLPHVKPLVLHLQRGEPTSWKISLSQTDWKFYDGDEKCTNGCPPEECLNLKALQSKKKGCVPVPLKDFVVNSSMTVCPKRVKSEQMLKLFHNFKEKIVECPKPKLEQQYQAIILDQYNQPKPNQVAFYVDFKYTSKTVKEETLIYDTLSFIGTLGGFLGLFLGFSFFGFGTDVCLGVCKRISNLRFS